MSSGGIADDFTGVTDLAGMLKKYGMRGVQTIGIPPASLHIDTDTVVVGLKSRAPALGAEEAGALVAGALAQIGARLVDAGVVAGGGETSYAAVKALGVQALRLGSEIDPTVPWTKSIAKGASVSCAGAEIGKLRDPGLRTVRA